MAEIHSTSVVAPEARIHQTCRIGPFCVIGPDVVLDEGVVLRSHIVVEGRTEIGPRTRLYPFASIGHAPQDLKYRGEASRLEIGADNTIREYVTMNPGTEGGGMVTRVGNNCLFMVGAHVAHDCQIGNQVIMANNATLAGHVVVGDYAVIGGLSAVHQFVRIGRYAMVGGMSGGEHDIIPYGMAMGERARLQGLNVVGMKRNGMERDQIQNLLAVYDLLFTDEGTLSDRKARVAEIFADDAEVLSILEFLDQQSNRATLQPK